jgi:outer membrane protein assembly factor BamE
MNRLLSLPICILLTGCANVSGVTSYLKPYRIDIRQGNFVSQEMVAQLKPGLTRDQVRFILGTPLVADLFHANRWDYVYHFQPGHGDAEERRVAVYFEDNKLARVDGDVTAGGAAGESTSKAAIRTIDIPAAASATKSEAAPVESAPEAPK